MGAFDKAWHIVKYDVKYWQEHLAPNAVKGMMLMAMIGMKLLATWAKPRLA